MDELIGNPNLKKRNSITRLELLGWVIQPIYKGLAFYNINPKLGRNPTRFWPDFRGKKSIYGRPSGKQRIWYNRV